MSHAMNENIRRLLELSQQMLDLADKGDHDRQDDSCGIMYGVLRDMGYRLKKLAESECEKHRSTQRWD